MALFLLLAFLLIPVAEIAVFIQVGDLVGLWPTLFGIVLTALLGAALVRRQGLQTLRRARMAVNRNEPPVAELFDGLCILLAGALLLTPGFLTDTLGFLLLIPPLRLLLRQSLWTQLLRRGTFTRAGYGDAGSAGPGSGAARPNGRGQVIEGEFEEVTDDNDEAPLAGPSVRDHPWKPRG